MADKQLSTAREWEDELLPDVIALLQSDPTTGATQLQSIFKIGYLRAAHLLSTAKDALPEFHRALSKADNSLNASGKDSATVAAIRLVLKLALDEMGQRTRAAENEAKEASASSSAYRRVIERIVELNLDRFSMSDIQEMIDEEFRQ